MSRMVPRRAAQVDKSQAGIVEALRAIPGVSVTILGFPVDLLVGARGVDIFMDCKTEDVQYDGRGRPFHRKGKATEVQEEFAKAHQGSKVAFVSTPQEAVEVVMQRVESLAQHVRLKGSTWTKTSSSMSR